MKGAVLLPSDLPRPSQVTYTASHKAGPSTIVEAFFADDLDGAYSTYHSAFENTAGYTVTKAEHWAENAAPVVVQALVGLIASKLGLPL